VNQKKISSLRNKNYSGNKEELNNLLSIILLGTARDEVTEGIEAVSKVKPGKSMTILIQRSVEGITVCSVTGEDLDMLMPHSKNTRISNYLQLMKTNRFTTGAI
jgi:hypothetical protein